MPRIELSDDQANKFASLASKARHDLGAHPLFRDDELAPLLDVIPRRNLQVFTMGTDPVSTSEWRRGSVGDLSGADLLAAARRGRLWFNVLRVNEIDRRFAVLLDELFTDLDGKVPGLAVREKRATLLVSSPGSQVYYHADAQPNLLWHVRGTKKLWVYPVADERFMTDDALGRILTGEADEQLSYREAWDAEAQLINLNAGEVAWWPQNSPHRVMNVEGFNVSLSTEYATSSSNRRVHVGAANYLLRRRLKVSTTSDAQRGVIAAVKAGGYRVGRRTGLLSITTFDRPVSFTVSADDPRGYTDLPRDVRDRDTRAQA